MNTYCLAADGQRSHNRCRGRHDCISGRWGWCIQHDLKSFHSNYELSIRHFFFQRHFAFADSLVL